MANNITSTLTQPFQNSNVALAGLVVLILAIMILPMPIFFMDVLLVMNITAALVILFIALYVARPLDFSVFPSVLLIITLFRLSLNIATTRLILGQGYAGELITSFGEFVVSGNYVVGVVIFLILVIINFVVITKGSTRIAEVSARFTLDAMPGKQMAIDADLNAGLIDDQEAQQRRGTIAQEAEFYGSMDGAAKFVRGDAMAGLLITAINIIGGFTIGMLQRGMAASDAANTYMLLTIGDGLVAQIPALIISTSAGIIITRATGKGALGSEIASQVAAQPKAGYITAGVLAGMGIVPGLPFFPFMLMAGLIGGASYLMQKAILEAAIEEEIPEEPEEAPKEEQIEDFLHPDPFEVEIGYGLIPLVDRTQGGNLLDRISTIRKSLAMELGIVVPPIRIRDNIQLRSNDYNFKIYGIDIAKGNLMMNHYLVLNPEEGADLRGIKTTEPTFGLPALWIPETEREKAEVAGYTVVEPPAIVATHLMEIIKANAHRLIDRQETKRMLEHLKKTHAAVVEGVVPELVSLGAVNQILKNLLEEKIPIRNIIVILETIADYAPFSKDPDILTDYVRANLADTITDYLKQGNNQVTVATFEPRLEDYIMQTTKQGGGAQNMNMSPAQVNRLFESIGEKVEQMVVNGFRPVLLVSPQIRRIVRSFIAPVLPNVAVIAYNELTPDTNLKSVGAVRFPNEA
ncbi:MAG TPA: flagellar biosynthesis protein FlhA [Candidatus Marinimicrobia bacterium]|nr:flagellar biosynthesis protein FlhA [Candidatus Neomarinimicrobiota bacterium]